MKIPFPFRPFLLLFFPLLVCACARQPLVVSGVLQGEHSWDRTVAVRGDVILAEGARLLIAPGTVVLFLPPGPGEDELNTHPNFPGSELIVRGTVMAEGTAAAPIVFRHVDAEAPAGGWGGINLQQSPEARFRHCLFTQADSAVHSQESVVTISESVFAGNRVGVRFHSSTMRIENNLLTGNETAIRFHFGAPVIRHNRIAYNSRGLFVTSYPRDYRIEGNDFLDNREYNVVLGEEVPEDMLMPGNWWGTLDTAAIEGSFFDGRRGSYLGRVIFTPAAAGPVAGEVPAWNR